MPNRNLKEVINSSRRLSRVSFLAALLFDRLISIVDDFGLFEAEPDAVKSRAFPLRVDVDFETVDTALLELDAVGVIKLYLSDGQRYGCMVDHQMHNPRRSNNPRHPLPPKWILDLCRQPRGKVARDDCSQAPETPREQSQANACGCEQLEANETICEQPKTSPLTLSLTLPLTLTKDQNSSRAIPDSLDLADTYRSLTVTAYPDHKLASDIVYDQIRPEMARQFSPLLARGKSPHEIAEMMNWAFAHPRWATVMQIRPAKVDEHWDTMSAQRQMSRSGENVQTIISEADLAKIKSRPSEEPC